MDERRVSWPSLVMLVIASLAVVSVSSAAPGENPAAARLALTGRLVAFWVAFLTLFLTQGYISSWAASLGFLALSVPRPADLGGAIGLLHEIVLLAAFALVLLAWSALGERKFAPRFWVGLAVAVVLCQTVVWLLAGAAQAGEASEWVGRARVRQLAAGLLAGGTLLGAALRAALPGRSWRGVGTAAALGLLCLPAGFGIARAFGPVAPESLLHGAYWGDFPGQLGAWARRLLGGFDGMAAWSWWRPEVVLPLMLIAVLMHLGMGRKQLRKGEMPLSWLLVLFAAAASAALMPVAPAGEGPGPLTLIFLGFVLSVAAIVGLLARMFSGIYREPPEPDEGETRKVWKG
ncbi:MAG TPA: hypothetical protein VIL46_18260 [Gemmataceae bacterium]